MSCVRSKAVSTAQAAQVTGKTIRNKYHFIDKRVRSTFNTSRGHLREVPKRFEVNEKNALREFERYITDIEDLVQPRNLTVKYKVKVEVEKPSIKKMARKKTHFKKTNKKSKVKKTKKYNVPLKKSSMQLSPYEMILRRLAEDNVPSGNQDKFLKKSRISANMSLTTEPTFEKVTIKLPHVGKYKPEISRVKTKYSKRVRPVRNREITL